MSDGGRVASESADPAAAVIGELTEIRRARERFLGAIAAGEIGVVDALAADGVEGRTWVASVLRAVQGNGKVATNRVLGGLGIDPTRPVSELDDIERQALAAAKDAMRR